MNNQAVNAVNQEEIEIDLLHIIKLLWKKIWIIAIAMILVGALCFSYAAFFVEPQYESTALMYVNNSSLSLGGTGFSISATELSAAKSLLEIYVVILQTRLTLEQVIEEANLDYTYEQLKKMVSAKAVNGTEIFSVTVTSGDPAEAQRIVSTIVDVLPDRISEVVDGSSVRLVDYPVIATHRTSPSYTKFAMIGILVGLVASCGVIIVMDLLDTTVRSEDYLNQKYDIPVLAVVPDANAFHKGSYYYKSYGSNGAAERNS